ncbi:hypothetical protein TSACC_21688 [Terrimicrobium sacchariphilum]|uniref:Uncharacterized protein n=1 Tax=Terrimicrobium sacchariphilum TaxID=690879 RepID=A0A146G6A5_TERSA|nr:hypothetical protein [Terrimicrobium sacchariphilum]GAT33275.1 hypothetical protein TSACC_21688 [Terrimicrobium sacchariphilum]
MSAEITNQPDLDSPDYWRGKQDEVRMQWAQNPAIAREYWESADNSWKCLEHTNWYDFAIYRPRPVALTDEQRDERDFKEWFGKISETSNQRTHHEMRYAWLASRKALREQQKGGAK